MRKNTFTKLKNDIGQWMDWDSRLPRLILDFYKILNKFTASRGETDPIL